MLKELFSLGENMNYQAQTLVIALWEILYGDYPSPANIRRDIRSQGNRASGQNSDGLVGRGDPEAGGEVPTPTQD